MNATKKLFDILADSIEINVNKNKDGSFAKDSKGNFIIEDEGHKQDGLRVRKAYAEWIKGTFPGEVPKLEAKFKKPLFSAEPYKDIVSMTPPFVPYMLAAGLIPPTKWLETMNSASADAEVIAYFVPENEFKQTIYAAYEAFDKAPRTVVLGGLVLPTVDDKTLTTLNVVLGSAKVPQYQDILKQAKQTAEDIEELKVLRVQIEEVIKAREAEKQESAEKIALLAAQAKQAQFTTIINQASGEVPAGEVEWRSANNVFPGYRGKISVPVWNWEGVHPDVPKVDPDYIFRPDILDAVLIALVNNERLYLSGHTGTGKTTLIEQVCARLKYPFARINFDSEITRMDLIGRDTLKEGKTQFVDGFLPRYLKEAYVICMDELDFVRPDVAYVAQAVLEGNGLVITEDGGRRVNPHPMNRLFATGNTVGQGDEHGMYQGARPQSMALLDRFTAYARVDYLDKEQRRKLLENKCPGLTSEQVQTIVKYSEEHLKAFEMAKVMQPLSPRGLLAIGNKVLTLTSMYPARTKQNVKDAMKMVVLDRASQGDYLEFKGIMDRVFQ